MGLQQTSDIVHRGLLTIDVAQILLENYRAKAIQHFPFVPIPLDTSAQTLRATKPFLFLCVMATMMVKNCTLQRQFGEEVRVQVHQRVLMESEISLELLQGLLIYLAWYQYFFSSEKQQIVQLAQLCVSLVQSLGLDQNPDNTRRKVDLGPDETASCRREARSTDQLRALLGTYCTTSWVSTKFRTRCAIPYTGYIKQSCELLVANGEYPSDLLVSYLVRVNELCRRIFDNFGYDDLENSAMKSEFVSAMALQTLSNESTLLKETIPQTLQDNREVSLHDDFWERSATVNSFTAQNPSLHDAVVKCPDDDLWYITFYTTAKICRTLACLSNAGKISPEMFRDIGPSLNNATFSNPTTSLYDPATIERMADLRGEANRLQTKFRQLSPLVQNTSSEPDIMLSFSDMIWAVFVAYEQIARPAINSGQGVQATSLDYLIPWQEQVLLSDTGSPDDYTSSAESGHGQSEALLGLGTVGDETWEELLDGLATITEHESALQV
ncbi:hypothetical protein FSARC_9375 [Fusarium sarcochroum]|uniref:Transcription factor domain-containing protein n=1 Tax=Fusarium sarcochroum TaxID=1208366 RepID=A0A8H4X5E3_9HYPO|nr:hypothetical protein FSARC_9375 [Fusarium sarcochroum]